MNKTNIEYLDFTWNPIAMLCDPVSAGCRECWHRRRAKMLANNPKIPKKHQDAYAGRSGPVLIESRLDKTFKRKKPAIIGVQFMGDLFHESIKKDWLHSIFGMMAICRRHTFIVLTKRPENAKAYFDHILTSAMIEGNAQRHWHELTGEVNHEWWMSYQWPLDNVWLGVSAENQQAADERTSILLQIPAAVRLISIEPILSPVDLTCVAALEDNFGKFGTNYLPPKNVDAQRLDWVICGPETGPRARPMQLEWARDVRDQCKAAGVPFFFKSAGKQETPNDLMVREFPE